jgi:hypothetical protein
MSRLQLLAVPLIVLGVLGITGCGGGDGPRPPPPPATYTVGGSVTGLSGTLVLQNNGGGNLTIDANGTFTFTQRQASATAYNVTVFTTPGQQACTVTNSAGNIGGANVTNITVTCANRPIIAGVVAVGTPLVGSVTVKDATGATRTAPIGVNGSYSVNVEGMTAPFMVRAEGSADGRTYVIHSAALAADLGGNINVTPLTDLAIANIAGQIASAYFDAGNFASLTTEALNAEINLLRTRLLPVLQALGVDASIDLLRSRFTPNESALDAALDVLRVTVNPALHLATITNVVTLQQIQDDIAVPASTEVNPPVMDGTGNLNTAGTDLAAIETAVANFGALFANGLPSAATIEAALSPTFFNEDVDRAGLGAYLSSQSNLVGSAWADVDVRAIVYDDAAGPNAIVDFTIKDAQGREIDRVENFGVRKDVDNVWRLGGDQRVMHVSAQVLSVKSACKSTGIEFEIDDEDSANNGGDIDHIMILGPGLPQGGLRFEQRANGDWDIAGQATSYYVFADDCGYTAVSDSAIAAIPDHVFYFFVPYSSTDNSVRVNFASGALDIPGNPFNGTYAVEVARHPPTLAEVTASTRFPNITAPTNAAALDGINGGALTLSANNLNESYFADLNVRYLTRLGDEAEFDAELPPATGGALTTTATLPAPAAGDAITFRSVVASTKDASRRNFVTQLFRDYYTVGGTVTGATGPLTVRLNLANETTLNSTGPYTFGASLPAGATYFVQTIAFPTGQVCSTASPFGTIATVDVGNVNINCTNYSVSGNILGLESAGLVLQLNGTNDLVVPVGDSFSFPTSSNLVGGTLYTVHIRQQPAGQTCTLAQATGNLLQTPNVNNVQITCMDNDTDPLSGTYQVTSYAGEVLGDRTGAYLTLYSDGTYIFALHQDDPDCLDNDGNGIEYGVYNWNQATGEFALLTSPIDTNGECGLGNDGILSYGTLVKNVDGTLTGSFFDTNESGDQFEFIFTPVASVDGTITGSWGDNQSFVVIRPDNTFLHATTKSALPQVTTTPGIEHGCYTLVGTPENGTLSFSLAATCVVNDPQTAVDTTGASTGFSALLAPLPITVTGDNAVAFGGPITPFYRSAVRIRP